MIEYKQDTSTSWRPIPATLQASQATFFLYSIRIGGVIYTKNTAEFRDAFEKEEFWSKLRD